ncbi:30S ribosomal protein S13 [Nanoarchaeota archaeon]
MAEFKHIVRIANTDIKGEKHILYGLTKIKGVSIMYANATCRIAGVDVTKNVGSLSDPEIAKLDDVVRNPLKNGMPLWMLNRRNDIESGADLHIIGGDLEFVKDQDIKRMRKLKTYKGMRHGKGLTVRGQKTKANFRKNKGKGPGVRKKAGAKSGRT